jgi:hypothetical protein
MDRRLQIGPIYAHHNGCADGPLRLRWRTYPTLQGRRIFMLQRLFAIGAVVPVLALAACGSSDDTVTGTTNSTATVRFINATNSNIDVSNGGTIATGNGNLGFGTSTSCMTVNTTGTGLSFNQAGTSTQIPGFTQSFATGGAYTVVAFPGSTGSTQFLTINDANTTPNTGQAGLRIVNAASGSGNLIAVSSGTALGTSVGFGSAGSFMSVNAGSQTISFNTGTGTSTVVSAGNLNFTAGQNYVLIIAPPAAGSTALRTFLVTTSGC